MSKLLNHWRICKCGKSFGGHGNRTLCPECGRKNEKAMQALRVEFNSVKGQVKRRDNKTCVDCGSKSDLNVHHIRPLSKGGSNDLSNMITLCHSCHMKTHHGGGL